MSTRERTVIFRCGSDSLVGVVHEPAIPETDVGVLIVVGGPQYRVGSHRQFTIMARAIAAAGLPVMRFDYRGMGDSEGETRNFESIDADIRAAMETMLANIPTLKSVVLWGLCDAASAALMYGWRDDRVSALILANPWVRTQSGEARSYVRHYYGKRLLQRTFWAKLITGRLDAVKAASGLLGNFILGSARRQADATARSFVERMRRGMAEFPRPILLLISEQDLTAREFVDLCSTSAGWRAVIERPTVRLVRLSGADHTFSRRSSLEEATAHCRRFLESIGRPLHAGHAA